MPGPTPRQIELSDQERSALEALSRKHSTSQQVALRARIVLGAADGLNNTVLAEQLGVTREMVLLWRSRWLSLQEIPSEEPDFLGRLKDLPRSGSPGRITPEQYSQIMAVACEPPENSGRPITHWSVRELVDEVIKRGIVSSISVRQVRRFLQRG